MDPGAWLYACDDGEQILDRAPDYVPHYLFGKQPYAREFAGRYKLPLAASLIGRRDDVSRTPRAAAHGERRRGERAVLACAAAGRRRRARRRTRSRATARSMSGPSATTSTCCVGDGGNIVVQTGEQGAFVVDTGEGKLSDKVIAAIRTLSANPIQFIANTSFRPSTPAATRRWAPPGRTRACRDRSSSLRRRAA